MRMSVLAKEYVSAEVTLRDQGAVVNPTADVVEMAFPVSEVSPVGGDWKTSTWETDSTSNPPRYLARCLVGPGGTFVPTVGLYDVWVRVTHSPEVPVIQTKEKLVIY